MIIPVNPARGGPGHRACRTHCVATLIDAHTCIVIPAQRPMPVREPVVVPAPRRDPFAGIPLDDDDAW